MIVVGAGLGGLASAAVLGREGKRVLVIEQHEAPGGYAHAFRRDGYVFDPAIHAIGAGAEGHFLDVLLRYLDVRDECEFIPLHDVFGIVFPDVRVRAPIGAETFAQSHIDAPDAK